MATILLEIGTEELPAGYLPPALAQLADLARARFQAERIAFADLHTWATPRRIALYVTGVAEQQAPAVREVRGPAVQAAFAPNGEPTQAAVGFARSQGLAINDLRIKKIDNGEYVVAIFREEGRPTFDLLPALLPQFINGLTFPKTMRWGSGNFRFARPIRWIVALMDQQVIPIQIDDVTSGRFTRGHRFLASGDVEISSAADYQRIMDENQVLVDQDARRETVRQQLEAIVQQEGAVIQDDGSLLDETTFHLEYPTAVRGAFEASFLSLPNAVLLQVLRREQNFFPLADETGKLLPAFLAVRNGDKAYLGSVREGYERVAHAKLLDALFFYEQDRQQPLTQRVDALRGMIFQESLGTLHDKAKRLESLAGLIAAWLNFPPEERQYTERAALLAKADLVTAMVTEFPELQGKMGAVYARLSDEPDVVAGAISEQYLPRGAGDTIPATTLGRILALADKVDTVTACFAVGLIPTGSEDPYGLRRDAQGAVRILAEADLPLSLSQLISRALRQLTVEMAQPREETQRLLETFFRQRVENLLVQESLPQPVIKAVMAVAADVPAQALRQARFLQQHLADPALADVTRVATRLANITRGFTGEEFPAELLTEPAERELYAQYQQAAPQAEEQAKRGDYPALFTTLATLIPAVDRFFADTLVMAEAPALRQARLALVRRLSNLHRLLGDLAQLGL